MSKVSSPWIIFKYLHLIPFIDCVQRVVDMRILLVEDDVKIATFILKGLKEAGFAADHATDGKEGLYMALNEPYDTAIIDIMLPKLDGLTLIEELRRKKINTPVIILSAKRSIDDRVKGNHKR